MAVCDYCEKDMEQVTTCIKIPIKINGVNHDPVKYGEESKIWVVDSEKCSDCGVIKGGYHHPGCAKEECPICGDRIESCGCIDEE